MRSPSLALAALVTSVLASPVEVPRAVEERAACTFTGAAGYAAAVKGKASCSTITLDSIVVPAGVTFDLTGLADNTIVNFKGTTKFGHKEWEGPLISISGKGIHVSGGGTAVLDGQGALYWDGKGSNDGVTKPKFFAAHKLTNSVIEHLTILNPPVQVFSINAANNLQLNYITVDGRAGASLGHNTDAFDIGSSDSVFIDHATVYNQDDCVAINSGSNLHFTNGFCSGGHGLSIGSIGGRDNNTVAGVTFASSTVTNSLNGMRIKTTKGTTGHVSGITYSDITLSKITKYGILVEQNYQNGDLKGDPTNGVPITGVTMKNIHGTGAVASSGYDVTVVCGTGSCTGWSWTGVSVTGGQKYASCANVPAVTKCS